MTAATLIKRWGHRNTLYALRRRPLTDPEAEAIRLWRRQEIEDLAPEEERTAIMVWRLWSPPTPRY